MWVTALLQPSHIASCICLSVSAIVATGSPAKTAEPTEMSSGADSTWLKGQCTRWGTYGFHPVNIIKQSMLDNAHFAKICLFKKMLSNWQVKIKYSDNKHVTLLFFCEIVNMNNHIDINSKLVIHFSSHKPH